MIITLNYAGKLVKHEIPNAYEVLPTGTFQRIMKEWNWQDPPEQRNYFKLFCILTGIDFKSFKQTEENEATIWKSIRWYVDTKFEIDGAIPKVLQINDKIIELPESPELLTIGQNIYLRQAIEKCKYLAEGISIALAIYLQPIYDEGKFSEKRAHELEKDIAKIPITIAGPAGFFLLQNALNYGTNSERTWRQTLTSHVKSLKKTWRQWRKSLV